MAKVRCGLCANEISGICKIKKIGVKPNKSRICEAYIFDESKLKTKEEVPTIKFGYLEQQEAKRRRKAERKAIQEMARTKPGQGTAKDLGLISSEEKSNIILPGDLNFYIPSTDPKHPLTGDLSRFVTTATDKKEE